MSGRGICIMIDPATEQFRIRDTDPDPIEDAIRSLWRLTLCALAASAALLAIAVVTYVEAMS